MGVIIEYKDKNKISIVESAAERRSREYHNAKRVRRAEMNKSHSTIVGSVKKEGTHRPWYSAGYYTDPKCWKNQKHARKNWMRHIHRLKASARVLADNCIYPNVCY